MTTLVHLDFETYSEADLPKVGAYRYAEDPSTEVLCLVYGTKPENLELWHPLLSAPTRLFAYAQDPDVLFAGWNSGSFERRIWNMVCTRLYGWPELRKEKWYDIMSDALACAFPASLDMAGPALRCSNLKDAAGKRLIKKLCCPVKPTRKHLYTRWTKNQAPDDFRALYDYCRKDVLAEMEIFQKLPAHPTLHPGQERAIWLHTQDINDRGLPIDLESVHTVFKYTDRIYADAGHLLVGLTDGRITKITQRDRIRDKITELGYKMENMQGLTIEAALDDPDLTGLARTLLQLYSDCMHTSVAKYKAILNMVCRDGRVRDNIVYHKAGTGRYAGAGFQMQNLPRDKWKNPDLALDALHNLSFDEIEFVYGPFVEFAKKLIRSMIKAENGHVITDDDLTGIEARMACWVSGERKLMADMGRGLDPYRLAAAEMYHKKYEDIPKSSVERQCGKVGVLAGQFGGGKKAILKEAKKQGLNTSDDEAQKIVDDFRAGRPKLPQSWKAFGAAAMEAVESPGTLAMVSTNVKFKFQMYGRHLAMHMPSGRKLWFPFAEVREVKTPWGELRDAVTAMWVSSFTHKWERRALIGSSLFQSAVQGLSRDVLLEAQLRIDPVFPVIGSVHDEIISHHPDDPALSVQAFQKLFSQVPAWCPDLPIGSDPWSGKRYKK